MLRFWFNYCNYNCELSLEKFKSRNYTKNLFIDLMTNPCLCLDIILKDHYGKISDEFNDSIGNRMKTIKKRAKKYVFCNCLPKFDKHFVFLDE